MGNNATYDFDVATVINKDGLDTIFQIVALRYCVEQNKCLLVYKYMSEKSLQESFFEDGHLSWNWQTRFDNVIDVAEDFEFLHFSCDPLMIHGDIKSNNVMLDSDYSAKISDFELLRIKVKGEIGMNLFYEDLRSQELGKSHDLSGTFGGTVDAHTPAIRFLREVTTLRKYRGGSVSSGGHYSLKKITTIACNQNGSMTFTVIMALI
ncbi:hypothetical protein V6N13_008086 [Hibiscus sabdariffa]